MKPTKLTLKTARHLLADGPSRGCATYLRAYEDGEVVRRTHTPASERSWNMDFILRHLAQGHRVELREGSADSMICYCFEGMEENVRAGI